MTRLVGPVAIVLSRFPTVTETFILREMDELDRLGVPVVPWPLLRETGAPVHAEAEPWMPRALFTPFLDVELARAVALAVARRPVRTLGTWLRALWNARGSSNAFGGTLGILAKCTWAARALRRRGVQHVHAHFATHPATAAWLARRLGDGDLPWSVTVHAHDIFISRAGLRPKLRDAAFVRCISRFNARFLRPLLGGSVELPVIHCGIEPERYRRRGAPGSPGASAELLCIASHRPYKGLTHLVHAMSVLRDRGVDARLTVIGDGPLRPELERQVRASQLGDRVDLAGTFSQEEVARRLSSCDVFVLPSVVAPDGQMEGIPVALMEALASEVPVVTTRLSGIPELVRDGETGLLVEPGDADALARAIEVTLDEPEAARRRAEAGRRLVESEFELGGTCRLLLAEMLEHGAEWRGPDDVAALAAQAAERAAGGAELERIGVSRSWRGRDALAVEILLPEGEGGRPRRLLAKRHLEREGATRPASARAAREHAALRAFGADGVPVPRAVALDEGAALVIMETVEGEGLDVLLALARRAGRLPERVADALGATARALASLESCPGPEREASEFTAEAVSARLDREIECDAAVVLERGVDERIVTQVAARAREGLRAAAIATCWTHGDAWPGNVIVRDDRVVLLDWEGAQPGARGEDVANVLEHLALSETSRWPGVRRVARAAATAVHRDAPSAVPSWLRAAKALRIAAWSPSLATGGRARRRRHARRLSAVLAELSG